MARMNEWMKEIKHLRQTKKIRDLLNVISWILLPKVHMSEAVNCKNRKIIGRLPKVVQRMSEFDAVSRQEVNNCYENRNGSKINLNQTQLILISSRAFSWGYALVRHTGIFSQGKKKIIF